MVYKCSCGFVCLDISRLATHTKNCEKNNENIKANCELWLNEERF